MKKKQIRTKPGSRLRTYHTRIVRKLKEAGALIIAFDIAFNTRDEKTDKELSDIIIDNGNVISGEIEEHKTNPVLRKSFRAIGSLYTEDYRNVPRRIHVYPKNTSQRALSVEIAEMYHNKYKTGKGNEAIKLPEKNFRINYSYKPDFFPIFSDTDILKSGPERMADEHHTPLSILKNKIVLIGYGQEQCYLPDPGGKKLPSLYTHTYAVENLLNTSYIKPVYPFFSILLLLLSLFIVRAVDLSKIHWLKLAGAWVWLSLFWVFTLVLCCIIIYG